MAMSDNVAIVALIVSLIALLIALLQLSQQFFGTAEGYRRCGESMIGSWSQMRWRKPIKSELRFETHFETPHIVLCPAADVSRFEGSNEEDFATGDLVYGLDVAHTQDRRLRQASSAAVQWFSHGTMNFRWPGLGMRRKVLYDLATSAKQRLEVTSPNGILVTISERSAPTEVEKSDVEKNVGRASAAPHVQPSKDLTPYNELTVSWLSLLRILSQLYDRTWSLDTDPNAEPGEDHNRTVVGVRFAPYIWDLLPADAQKPLATSDVGTIIILAVRMGMQWRTLKPDEGRMSADGNGYLLSAVETRGLGLVLKLRSIGKHEHIPAIVQNTAGDKLICGVLPGCPHLVKQDFNIVAGNRELEFEESVTRRIGSPHYKAWECSNELPVLLCDFLPLHGDRAIVHTAFAREGMPPGRSTFSWWEGRYALLLRLSVRAVTLSDLKKVHDHLKGLEEHRDFYYNGSHEPSKAIQAMPGTPSEKRTKQSLLLHNCREAFNWTTQQFKDLKYDQMSPDGTNTFYVCLVAAHYRVSRECVGKHRELEEKHKDAWNSRMPPMGTWPGPKRVGSHDVFQMAYENSLHVASKEDWSIMNAMARRGKDIGAEDAEFVWWLLMLRGIAWILSTEPSVSSHLVPAEMYGNPTPVWIT